MSLTFLRHATQKPPNGNLTLAVGHPLATGLVAYLPMIEVGSATLYDQIGRSIFTPNTPLPWTGSDEGPSPLWQKLAYERYYSGVLNRSIANGPFTIVADGRCDYRSGAYYLSIGSAGANDQLIHIAVYTLGSVSFNLYNDDLSASYSGLSDGSRFFLVCRMDEAKNQSILLNNTFSNSRTSSSFYTGTQTFTVGDRFDQIGDGSGGPNTSGWSGTINFIAVYDRALSDAEAAQIYAEPYAMFQARPLQKWLVFSNPLAWTTMDGVTTSNLWYQISEPIADDTSFIESPSQPATSSTKVRLGTVQQPISGTITLHSRAFKDISDAVHAVDYTVALMQGATTIQSFTHTNISTTPTQFDDVVSNAITDWATPFDVQFTMNESA